jgi:DNA-binding response OmpR family regulator
MDVLVIEDDDSLVRPLLAALRARGLSTDCAADSVEARRLIARKSFRVITVALLLKSGGGLELIDYIRSNASPGTGVVVITAADPAMLRNIDRSVVKTVLFKPVAVDNVAAYLEILTSR